MASTVTHTIGTAGAPGRDYSTISAWEADQQRDLVSADEIEVGECYNDGEMTNYAIIDGFTTDGTRYVKLYAPATQRRLPSDPFRYGYGFRVNNTTNYKVTLTVGDDYTKVEGLEIQNSAPVNGLNYGNISVYADGVEISECIFYNGVDCEGIHLTTTGTTRIWNCLIYNMGKAGIRIIAAGTFYLDNITIYNSIAGVVTTWIAQTTTMKNVVSMANTSGDFIRNSGTFNVDYCCSSDATADDWGGSGNLINKTAANQFVSVTGGSEDFHVKDTDADIYDAGTDSPSSSFTDDIDRQTRIKWCMGAHELITATAFICTLNKTGQDYDNLSDWESAVLDGVDLTDAKTRAYDVSSVTGTVSDGATVTGQTNSYQATVKHVNVSGTSPRRVMVVHDTDDEEFVDSEVLQVDGSNYITLANPCNSDMVIPAAELYNDDGELSDTVAIDNTTTGAATYIRIYAPDAERRSSSNPLRYGYGARITGNTNSGVITIAEQHVRVEGVEVNNADTSSTNAAAIRITNPGDSEIYISDCVLKGGRYSIRLEDDCRVKVWDTVTYGGGNGGVGWAGTSEARSYFYNCTLIGTSYGSYEDAGYGYNYNCYMHGAAECAVSCDGYKSYCSCSDESLDDEGTYDNLQQNVAYSTSSGAYFTSITGGSEDYHIGSSSTLKDNGTDDPASGLYSDDIDRQTWTSPWDIGAVQYAAPAVGVAVPVLSKDGIHSLVFGGQVVTG